MLISNVIWIGAAVENGKIIHLKLKMLVILHVGHSTSTAFEFAAAFIMGVHTVRCSVVR